MFIKTVYNLWNLYEALQQQQQILNKRMQRESLEELTIDQLKRREIAQKYVKVEQNTESLTQILRYNPKFKKLPLRINIPFDLRSFYCLIVQVTYLLYTCFIQEVNLLISNDLFVKSPRKGEILLSQEVYCEYLLQIDVANLTPQEQEAIEKKFRIFDLSRLSCLYGQYVCDYISKVRNLLRLHLEKIKNSPQGFYYRQMENLIFIIENFLVPQRKIEPKIVILCLEQSEIFREYSMLSKCLNNSIFAAIRFSPKSKEIYSELVQIETRAHSIPSKNEINEHAKKVEGSIQQCIKLLLKYHIVSSEQSLNETSLSRQEVTVKPYLLGELQNTNTEHRKYFIKVYVWEKPLRKFTNKTMETLMNKLDNFYGDEGQEGNKKEQESKGGKSEYLIDYYSTKGLLCIKYITNIELNIENTDILMFHCNYMTYSWNNITLEFVEKSSGKSKRKQRYLAFKTVSYLNPHQKIIFKILAMIDLLMVYAKITEPQLRKGILNMDDYHYRNTDLNNQCEHMKRIFIRKIEKNYQVVQQKMMNFQSQ